MYSKEKIIDDIKALGITAGDMVFIRISYKSIGGVDGGPLEVLNAILEIIGPQGTLLATAFPRRVQSFGRHWKKKCMSSTHERPVTGVLPVLMSQHPKVYFSKNIISPYVIIGRDAEIISDNPLVHQDPYGIVEYIINNYSPKCLRIGGRLLDGTTHLAFSKGLRNTHSYQKRVGEGMYYRTDTGKVVWQSKNISSFCYDKFEMFFNEHIKDFAVLAEGKVGDGVAMVTDMSKTYEVEMKFLSSNPAMLQCDNPHCVDCRCSYSFSDNSIFGYIFKEVRHLFRTKDAGAKNRIKDALKLFIMGERCQ